MRSFVASMMVLLNSKSGFWFFLSKNCGIFSLSISKPMQSRLLFLFTICFSFSLKFICFSTPYWGVNGVSCIKSDRWFFFVF